MNIFCLVLLDSHKVDLLRVKGVVFLCYTCFFFLSGAIVFFFYLIYGCFTAMHFGLWHIVFAYMRLWWGLLNMCLLKMVSPLPCLFTVLRFLHLHTFKSLHATFSPSKYHKPLFPIMHLPNSQLSSPHSLDKFKAPWSVYFFDRSWFF